MKYIFIKSHYHGFNKQYIFLLEAYIFYLFLYVHTSEIVHYDRRFYIIAIKNIPCMVFLIQKY